MIRVGLTRRQRDLLDLLERREDAGEPPPSFDEMKLALGLNTKSGVHRLVTALEERGHVRRLPNRARAITLVREPAAPTVPMPVAPAERPRLGIPTPVAEQLRTYCDRRRLAAHDVLAAALMAYMEGHP